MYEDEEVDEEEADDAEDNDDADQSANIEFDEALKLRDEAVLKQAMDHFRAHAHLALAGPPESEVGCAQGCQNGRRSAEKQL